jgi:cold shock CspA family protein
MNGKIIKYFSRRGFGFIAPENSQEEIFFHISNYPEQVQPEIGNDVEFELFETPKGNEATNIKLLPDAIVRKPPEAEEGEADSPKVSILGITEIKGVGKNTEEKLRKAGFDTVESIASVDAETISEKTGISSKVTAKLIVTAKELIE